MRTSLYRNQGDLDFYLECSRYQGKFRKQYETSSNPKQTTYRYNEIQL